MTSEARDWYERLTNAERAALEAYAKHHSYQAAADALGKSESVIDQQLLSARRKMGAISTAEAMYMLAQRKGQSASDGSVAVMIPPNTDTPEQDASPPHVEALAAETNSARWWKVGRLGFFMAIVGIVGLLAFGLYRHSTEGLDSVSNLGKGIPNTDASAAEIADSLVELRRSGQPNAEAVAARRLVLVTQLCDRLWQDQWGPEEANDASIVVPSVESEILSSFQWAIAHKNVDHAAEIIGNGHRVFRLVGGELQTWPRMIDQVLQAPNPPQTVYFGRTLVGFAFSKVLANSGDTSRWAVGYRRAAQAVTLFRRLGSRDADEANALRHLGMCCYGNPSERHGRYLEALTIYQRLMDRRGIAQTLLSIAQEGSAVKSADYWDQRTKRVLAAVDAARIAGGAYSLGEAQDELKVAHEIPGQPQYWPTLRAVRLELLRRVVTASRNHAGELRLFCLIECLRIDEQTKDRTAKLKDMEAILTNPAAFPFPKVTISAFTGFYLQECQRARHTPLDSMPGDTKLPAYRTGLTGSKRLYLQTLEKLRIAAPEN